MSSCCDNNQEPTVTPTPVKNTESNRSDKEPTNPIEKIFWKIGKADAEKKQNRPQKNESCCG